MFGLTLHDFMRYFRPNHLMGTIHIIGAGVSGLSCATRAVQYGANVVVYEATEHAGGRARSFYDNSLGCLIDNGNHLLLGANEFTQKYLTRIKSTNKIKEIAPALFPFVRPETGDRWQIRPGGRLFPIWILFPKRRIPRTSAKDYIKQIFSLRNAGKDDTVVSAVGANTVLFKTFWEPLCRAALNTEAAMASAQLLWQVFRNTFMKGEEACRPSFFNEGLAAALIDPALKYLAEHNSEVQLQRRLRRMEQDNDYITSLYFAEGKISIATDDAVVLALPPDATNQIWPDAGAPVEARTIVIAHFRLDYPVRLPGEMPFVGLIGTESQWLFLRENILSITVSADDGIADKPSWEIARLLWLEAAMVLDSPTDRLPAWRIIKERRATFAQTPSQVNSRPDGSTVIKNLFLAGDWTNTGLPATIEGGVKSGFDAASNAIKVIGKNSMAGV